VGGDAEWVTYGYGPPSVSPPQYRIYRKEGEFSLPGPALTWVLVDEHPDSINDGLFGMRMPPYTLWPRQPAAWDDVPASYHNGACGFAFADGHAEIHKWLDANTKVPIHGPPTDGCSGAGSTSPRDSLWVVARSSAPY
jgi:prepilin-type processing-associated H-X9-DG protein